MVIESWGFERRLGRSYPSRAGRWLRLRSARNRLVVAAAITALGAHVVALLLPAVVVHQGSVTGCTLPARIESSL